MGKVVLTQRDDSRYADQDGVAYHFPRRYLERISAAIGDYAVFYQPRRGTRGQCYWAIAKIDDVRPDPELADHFYALLSDHAEFPNPVTPWKSVGKTWESTIQLDERTLSRGRMGWSVRPIPDDEFYAILAEGMQATAPHDQAHSGLNDNPQPPLFADRTAQLAITNRIVRDAAFSRVVASAYEGRCAITGLRVLDLKGHSEMEAAHIRPVSERGPDIACNGVALCRTAHWLFDHGLISISNDFRVLRSRQLPGDIDSRLKLTEEPIWVPKDSHLRPHKTFLEYHRDEVFTP